MRQGATSNLPNSSLDTSLLAIERIDMKEVPFRISTIGPIYSCHVVVAKAYTKLDKILDIEDITPIRAS